MPIAELGLPYDDVDWAHGLMCAVCPHVFREGERYTTDLYAFSDDVPMVTRSMFLSHDGCDEKPSPESANLRLFSCDQRYQRHSLAASRYTTK
jgi:hypothetical protein